eukprot:CAMPEP_0201867876 /NCGR_PEP_ID=MMETSP0902-20130614/1976_1 /ASSEMBLY_ACC=CAM_ASM_000551 /TAXON_ID=420261 /ORGANISM="Thalassiosira antarctica, Strain CCMP982" /LENGTH=76 /DNA_ID=CAMNT_0048393133 /DNA_START=106 /DNA_END=336 /DNA_ORIENTATION=-
MAQSHTRRNRPPHPSRPTTNTPLPPLALAVASEWDAQKIYLQLAQMPLMTLSCTAIQVASDPTAHQLARADGRKDF